MKYLRKITAALSAAALFLSLVPTALASEIYGQEMRTRIVPVADGTAVTAQATWNQSPRTEHYLTYTPGGTVHPAVRWGDYLTSRRTLDQMAQTLEGQGQRVVGGINASFFESNGSPIGVVISGGRVYSANPDYEVIGFKADGTALMGRPEISLTAAWTVPEQTLTGADGTETVVPAQERSIPLAGLNKIRNAGGYYLISGDYAPDTQNSLDGVDVVLRPDETQRGLPLSGSVACHVVAVRSSVADTSIPEGCFVLSMNVYSDAALVDVLRQFKEGDELTLRVTITSGWEEVTEAVSGLLNLIVGGAPSQTLPSDGRAPRTAVGLRGDGSVVLYTVDGRQNGYSVGASYQELAVRMIELGCETAIVLDGGGSTTLGATYPDSEVFQTLNRPSDGSARAVSVCLFLVEDASTAAGELDSIAVNIEGPVQSGGTVPVEVLPVDTTGRAMSWEGELTWTAALGTVTSDGAGGWTYTAPVTGVTAVDTLTVTGGGVSGEARVTVGVAPTALALRGADGEAVTELKLTAGESVQLTAVASLNAWPMSGVTVSWSVTPEAGTVDGRGLLTASTQGGSGYLTVSAGEQIITVPVEVTPPEEPDVPETPETPPETPDVPDTPDTPDEPDTPETPPAFVDIDGHWAEDYIQKLYEYGLTGGTVEADGQRYYHPSSRLTRQEWCTFLVRLLGEEPGAYDAVELPFADAAEIDTWALPYVRAAYALGLMGGTEVDGKLVIQARSEITRQETMTVVGRAIGDSQEADLSVFVDGDQVSDWALPHVQTLVALGVVTGNEGRLNPRAAITRAEAAKLLCAVLGG